MRGGSDLGVRAETGRVDTPTLGIGETRRHRRGGTKDSLPVKPNVQDGPLPLDS